MASGTDRQVEREISLASVEEQNEHIEALEEIIAFLIHELRNPLAVVKGFAEALEEATDRMDEAMMRTSASAIRRNAENLTDFVNSLADVYSLTSKRMRLQRNEVLVSEFVNETVADLQPVLNGNPVQVRIEDDARLSLDRIRARQALTNLLTNAVKYGPEDAPVDVIVSKAADDIEICVADRGPGIPDDKAGRLFKKFTRLKGEGDGMGIGLFISRGIAQAHGGDLYLGDGEGCRFVLRFPAVSPS